MSGRMRALVATCLSMSLGCAAIHHPRPMLEPARSRALSQPLPRWVVGVREPVVRYVDPDAGAPGLVAEVEEATRLVRALRRTGLFAEVDFTRRLGCPADIEIVAIPHKGERLKPAPV